MYVFQSNDDDYDDEDNTPMMPIGPPIIVETPMGVKKKGKKKRRTLAEKIAEANAESKENLLKKLVRILLYKVKQKYIICDVGAETKQRGGNGARG